MIELFFLLFIISNVSYVLHYFIELSLLTITDNSAKKHLVSGIIIAILTVPVVFLIKAYKQYTLEITLLALMYFMLNFIQGMLDVENYKRKKTNLIIVIISSTIITVILFFFV